MEQDYAERPLTYSEFDVVKLLPILVDSTGLLEVMVATVWCREVLLE